MFAIRRLKPHLHKAAHNMWHDSDTQPKGSCLMPKSDYHYGENDKKL